jgi:hypothetical protein
MQGKPCPDLPERYTPTVLVQRVACVLMEWSVYRHRGPVTKASDVLKLTYRVCQLLQALAYTSEQGLVLNLSNLQS